MTALREDPLVLRGAQQGDGQVGEGGAGPFDRVLEGVTRIDTALLHPVSDTGPAELHDHVGRPGELGAEAGQVPPDVEVRPCRQALCCGGGYGPAAPSGASR